MKSLNSRLILFAIVALIALGAWFVLRHGTPDSTRTDQVAFQFDWVIGGNYSPFILADEKGFYREEGIEVKFDQGKGAELATKLVNQGKYDLATSNAAAVAIARSNGLHIISVGMLEQDAITSVFALESSGIREPADILGRKIGVRYYDISHSEYLAMMRAQGLDPKEVQELSIGFDLQPLLAGEVDVMYNYAYNMPVRLREKGYEIVEFLVKDWGVIGYGSNIISSDTFAKEKPGLLKRFLRATAKGWTLAFMEPELAIDTLVKRFPEIDRETALNSFRAELPWLKQPSAGSSTSMFCQSKGKWESALQTYLEVGLLKSTIVSDTVFTNEFLSGCHE